jgi:hypothetical protein
MIGSNTKMIKLLCDGNTFNHRYLDEIQNACKRNKEISKVNTIPKYKDELGLLILTVKQKD